jgi:threonine synthase
MEQRSAWRGGLYAKPKKNCNFLLFVSPRQAHKLGFFGDNIHTYKVSGSFDDCQALVKQALNDANLQRDVPLSSADSISLGRLLPQMSYYAYAALTHWRAHGQPLPFVVPTGNLGNAFAAILARALGLPLGRIMLATNANDVLPALFDGADYTPRASIATLANAMDVGAPSNFERLRWLYPDDEELRRAFRAERVDDEAIRDVIARRYRDHGEVFCPHTACAVKVLEDLRRDGADGDWCVVSTAHPAKFDSIVEPLIRRAVEVPTTLAALLQRPATATPLLTEYAKFKDVILREKWRPSLTIQRKSMRPHYSVPPAHPVAVSFSGMKRVRAGARFQSCRYPKKGLLSRSPY